MTEAAWKEFMENHPSATLKDAFTAGFKAKSDEEIAQWESLSIEVELNGRKEWVKWNELFANTSVGQELKSKLQRKKK